MSRRRGFARTAERCLPVGFVCRLRRSVRGPCYAAGGRCCGVFDSPSTKSRTILGKGEEAVPELRQLTAFPAVSLGAAPALVPRNLRGCHARPFAYLFATRLFAPPSRAQGRDPKPASTGRHPARRAADKQVWPLGAQFRLQPRRAPARNGWLRSAQ